jgi:hypothetical protein
MMVKVTVFFTSGDKQNYKIKVTDTGDFDWTPRSTSFIVPKPYNKIQITIQYTRQRGTVWFDDLRLTKN